MVDYLRYNTLCNPNKKKEPLAAAKAGERGS